MDGLGAAARYAPPPGCPLTALRWVHHDGGRLSAPGHGGTRGTNDCSTRAIAIALSLPYGEVYDTLTEMQRVWAHGSRARHAKALVTSGRWHARHGVHREVIHRYLVGMHGWQWVPTMYVGSGATVHMAEGELPHGRLVVNLSRHVAAVIDGTVYDTHDPCRDGTRAVYGYWLYP